MREHKTSVSCAACANSVKKTSRCVCVPCAPFPPSCAAGEQHHPQRLGDVQRHTHPQLGGGRVLQRGPRALQAVHVRRRDAVPSAGEIPQHGLPDLRQPLREGSLGHWTGFTTHSCKQSCTDVEIANFNMYSILKTTLSTLS